MKPVEQDELEPAYIMQAAYREFRYQSQAIDYCRGTRPDIENDAWALMWKAIDAYVDMENGC